MTVDLTPHDPGFDPEAAIGERIALAMRRQGVSQGQMAEWLHMDQSVLSKKLRGLRRWYFIEVATCSARLGLHLAELVGGTAPAGWAGLEPIEGEARPKGFEPLTFCLVTGRRRRHLRAVA